MGLSAIMTSSTAALKAVQAQMQWRSDNISNANSTTYARRDPSTINTTGHTVDVTVARASNDGLFRLAIDANSQAQAATTGSDYLTRIGDILGTTQGTSYLQDRMDDFTSAWQAFETDPASSSAEAGVVAAAGDLVQTISDTAAALRKLGEDASASASDRVTTLNGKLSDLAEINKRLSAAPDGGASDPDLLDQRDSLVSDISGLVGVTPVNHSDGSVALYTKEGAVLVDHEAQQFQWNDTTGGQPYLSLSGAPTTAPGLNGAFSGGTLGATLNFLDPSTTATDSKVGTLAKAQAQLDAFASLLADTTTAGSFGNAYDTATADRTSDLAGGVFTIDTAGTLTASQSLAVASGLTDGTATLKRLSATAVVATLTDDSRSLNAGGLSAGNKTYGGLAAAIAGYHADAAAVAEDDQTRLGTAADSLQLRLSSEIGVNMDTEIAQLTMLQNAYAANAKVMSVAQQMFDTLLSLKS